MRSLCVSEEGCCHKHKCCYAFRYKTVCLYRGYVSSEMVGISIKCSLIGRMSFSYAHAYAQAHANHVPTVHKHDENTSLRLLYSYVYAYVRPSPLVYKLLLCLCLCSRRKWEPGFKAELNYFNCKWEFNMLKTIALMLFMCKFFLPHFKYMSFHIFHLLNFTFYGYITNSQNASLPFEEIAQLVLHQFHKGCWLSLFFVSFVSFWNSDHFFWAESNYKNIWASKIKMALFLLLLHGPSLIDLFIIWAPRGDQLENHTKRM